ncbi:AbiV family abortive infection protein [Bradyrhizobium japonicum]|uniref:AbiV family abortive infection protein n=1 Tax=Bradyrhizobium japonicum TaxID=375 RepID=UPI0004027780|nr:AbiV family abortive infection protein [Bradyrhizobium japonicum]
MTKLSRDESLLKAMDACVGHASDLLDSARAVMLAGHPNIAYHLAALALEEIGRRALLGVQAVSKMATVPPAWPKKHEQDHVKKLFWCFFGGGFFSGEITGKRLDEMSGVAQRIHDTRLLGLYVDSDVESLVLPSRAVAEEEAKQLISLAEASIELAKTEKPREEIPQEEIDLQAWFLAATDDPEKRNQIFSKASMKKLVELKGSNTWARWLKDQFDRAVEDGRLAAERELERSRNAPEEKTKEKWRLRVRITCASHSIRTKVLSNFNKKSSWIKLSAVSGKKDQIFIDFILGDNVPVQALWYFGWGVARSFVVALNIGTMGFWWWRMPEQIDRYYETIRDLENHQDLRLQRQPSLKIDWGENRALADDDLARSALAFAALTKVKQTGYQNSLDFYIGGLTFLSLNDVHWQCEVESFGNFFRSLRAMMAEHNDWQPGTPFEPAVLKFLDRLFPQMDERDRYAELCRAFDRDQLTGVVVTLKEVSFIKLFCDAYFLSKHNPSVALQEAP